MSNILGCGDKFLNCVQSDNDISAETTSTVSVMLYIAAPESAPYYIFRCAVNNHNTLLVLEVLKLYEKIYIDRVDYFCSCFIITDYPEEDVRKINYWLTQNQIMNILSLQCFRIIVQVCLHKVKGECILC